MPTTFLTAACPPRFENLTASLCWEKSSNNSKKLRLTTLASQSVKWFCWDRKTKFQNFLPDLHNNHNKTSFLNRDTSNLSFHEISATQPKLAWWKIRVCLIKLSGPENWNATSWLFWSHCEIIVGLQSKQLFLEKFNYKKILVSKQAMLRKFWILPVF